MTAATLRGKPDAGNPHVWFAEGGVASYFHDRRSPRRGAKPRRVSPFYKRLASVALAAFATLISNGEETICSEPSGWRFFAEGDAVGKPVTVPHDWAIYGPVLKNADGTYDDQGRCGGYNWKGRFRYEADFLRQGTNTALYLEFGGVMAQPRVFVNGRFAGGWDYGYMSFALDVSQLADVGTNRLTVCGDTTQRWSRWYPGAGVYRPVKVIERPFLHVVPGTMCITTPEVTRECARVEVACETSLYRTNFSFVVEKPHLWDVDDPHLYTLEFLGEKFRYGIRTFMWTADDGFHLNGRRVQLKGANLHSDLGPLGMEFHVDAAKRQLLLMKDMGCNALRTSHNPPAMEVLDLCDELGIVVWDECFDDWRSTADIPFGARWDESVKRNLDHLVRRDRNHPCVIAWSIGNEIWVVPEGGREKERNQLTADRVRELADFVRALDQTRPVAMGCQPSAASQVGRGIYDSLDLVGWNYRESYKALRKRLPKMPLVYSESASAVSSAAGYYELPVRTDKYAFNTNTFDCSGYDMLAGENLDPADVEFLRVERDRYLAGEFVWTGIDYIGEPTPFWKNARISYFGAADLCGFPKDRFWLYRSHWNNQDETCHIVPSHWNFSSDCGSQVIVSVYVYTSGDEAEVFLNGVSQGRRSKLPFGDYDTTPRSLKTDPRIFDHYRLRWSDVVYRPGELRVVAYRNGCKIGEKTVRTAGEPVRVRIARDAHSPVDSSLDFYRVTLMDAYGVEVPNRFDRLFFTIEGDGEILAVGNGNAHGVDSYRETASHPLFYGQALVIVRKRGEYALSVRTANLAPAHISGK